MLHIPHFFPGVRYKDTKKNVSSRYSDWCEGPNIVILFSFLELQKIVGQNIRAFRRGKAWSIEQLAEHANVSPAYLGELERGRENVSIKTISSIAKALKISPDLLLKENSK